MGAEKLNSENEEAWYSSVDMPNAHGEVPLQIIGGESTGTYRFVTGFYGLMVMPTAFQKVTNVVLA